MKKRSEEVVREINQFPSPMTPSYPIFISDEDSAVLSYQIAICDREKDFNIIQLIDGHEDPYAIIHFTGICSSQWTPFCQESLGKHPLCKAGLRWFSVNEVENSSYCKFIGFEPDNLFKRRHLVFQFEDSTFECISEKQELYICKRDKTSVLNEMIRLYG